MNDAGGEHKWTNYWYHADEDGQPDLARPMTHPEMVEFYWEAVDDNPNMLAELYWRVPAE
jgi:hypothetical protein